MSSIFKPKIPKPPAPVPMPDPDGLQALQARRRAFESARSRGGRDSTILNAPMMGGGSSYTGSSLGGGGPA
jgi:hypothetical protein